MLAFTADASHSSGNTVDGEESVEAQPELKYSLVKHSPAVLFEKIISCIDFSVQLRT